ncbi:hypothetical protein HK099_003612 [Clydaea vesicula]|uniref:C2H2-type domain-containing protein n=1 Tax=Clydaea vesicula TaxID=447962 RepID=A0AAD5U487_9FUNG|nr:hypothetical protein HK099_003612 [Clydaea vesicula]
MQQINKELEKNNCLGLENGLINSSQDSLQTLENFDLYLPDIVQVDFLTKQNLSRANSLLSPTFSETSSDSLSTSHNSPLLSSNFFSQENYSRNKDFLNFPIINNQHIPCSQADNFTLPLPLVDPNEAITITLMQLSLLLQIPINNIWKVLSQPKNFDFTKINISNDTQDSIQQNTTTVKKKKKNRVEHLCPECGKVFTRNFNLKQHLISHARKREKLIKKLLK